jgi:hypothetical protein
MRRFSSASKSRRIPRGFPSSQNTQRIEKAGYDRRLFMGDNKLVRLLMYVTGLVNQPSFTDVSPGA